MIKNIYNLGDAALYCDFGDTVNKETNLKVINYFNDIRKKNITFIISEMFYPTLKVGRMLKKIIIKL